MARKYQQDCIDECKVLYVRYNGQHHAKIAEQMNKRWAGFNEGRIAAWAKQYRWDELITKKLEAELEQAGWSNAQRAYQRIRRVIDALASGLEASNYTDTDTLKTYRDFCSLEINALARLDAERGSLEAFVAHWEWQLKIISEISPRAGKELVAISEEILQRAQDYFSGKSAAETE